MKEHGKYSASALMPIHFALLQRACDGKQMQLKRHHPFFYPEPEKWDSFTISMTYHPEK
ncbi:hypothetical protein V2K00_12770 [Pseudomonas alliivorans]|nr:hypothetical protein [Pseudomonas alliivorans]